MLSWPLVVIVVALLCVGALLGAALYDAVVLAPNLRGGPAGLEHGRLFMSAATPGTLFRIVSPACQILALLAVATNWSSPQQRWSLIGALLALVASDVITFTYHYPRNRLMFTAPLTIEPNVLDLAARQWAAANLARVALVLGAWVGTVLALVRLVAERHPGSPV
jgi:hypothetical protein